MSRSGYDYDGDGWDDIRWRGAVASAIRGRRGQAFLRELLEALDGMEEPGLIGGEFATVEGDVCALGAVAQRRGLPVLGIDSEAHDELAELLGIAPALVREIEFENDEAFLGVVTPRERWERMRSWVLRNLHDREGVIAGGRCSAGGDRLREAALEERGEVRP